jgi:nucleoside-diphosphate kinase
VLVGLSLWGTSFINLVVEWPDGKYFGSIRATSNLRERGDKTMGQIRLLGRFSFLIFTFASFAFGPSFAQSVEKAKKEGASHSSSGSFMTERTLCIIKPEAVERGLIGEILKRFESAGLRIVAARLVHLTNVQAESFYAVNKERPFYASLTKYFSSGPIFVSVLEGENAVRKTRDIIGATDPAKAAPGTIRHDLGTDVERNAVHGSDGRETASWEIAFFFKPNEIHSSKSAKGG